MAQWIKCAERMPPRYDVVLVSSGVIVPRALMAWDGKGWRIGTSDISYDSPVTHWMPLPAPPNRTVEGGLIEK